MHVENVLDPDYVPGSGETVLFNAHNNFMYGIFERTVATTDGQRIVRRYAVERNAQAVFQELCKQAVLQKRSSLVARDTAVRYLTNVKLDHRHVLFLSLASFAVEVI